MNLIKKPKEITELLYLQEQLTELFMGFFVENPKLKYAIFTSKLPNDLLFESTKDLYEEIMSTLEDGNFREKTETLVDKIVEFEETIFNYRYDNYKAALDFDKGKSLPDPNVVRLLFEHPKGRKPMFTDLNIDLTHCSLFTAVRVLLQNFRYYDAMRV